MIETMTNPNASNGHNIQPVLPTGLNTPICSDWREAIKQVPDKSIDLLLTDPPYGMQFQSNHRKVRHKRIQGDDSLEWLGGWAKEMHRVMKQEAHLYIFCSWHNVDAFKREIGAYFEIKNILIWEKNNTGMGDLEGDYAPKYEMILFCSNGSKKLNGGRDANILKAKRTGNENHPTEKPTNLLAYLIEKSSNVGDVVLDTFAGSFSTAQACIETGRNYLCFEIEEEYCRIAKNLLAGKQRRMFI
jgi:site-specific DNA-methyltransferase (adenine-specific)